MAYTEEEWAGLKRAALEYSTYRPRLVFQALAPEALTVAVLPPEGAINVESCDYGDEMTFTEVNTAGETATGWHYMPGQLLLTPTVADTTINIVWRVQHLPDEATQTFPTIPAKDFIIVEWLAQAAEMAKTELEMATEVSSYTIGQTSVKWGTQASGTISPAASLRLRALQALDSPIGVYG